MSAHIQIFVRRNIYDDPSIFSLPNSIRIRDSGSFDLSVSGVTLRLSVGMGKFTFKLLTQKATVYIIIRVLYDYIMRTWCR